MQIDHACDFYDVDIKLKKTRNSTRNLPIYDIFSFTETIYSRKKHLYNLIIMHDKYR